MIGSLIVSFFLNSAHAGPATCKVLQDKWRHVVSESEEGILHPPTIAALRPLVTSCSSQPGFENYNLNAYNAYIKRGYEVEYLRELEANMNGLNDDHERLRYLARMAERSASPELTRALSQPPAASSCKLYDYRAKLPPVRDQGAIGWCYGYAGADLVSFKTGDHVSALDAAISGHKNFNDSLWKPVLAEAVTLGAFNTTVGSFERTGSVADVINGIKKEGYCLETQFRSNDSINGEALLRSREAYNRARSHAQTASGSCDGDCELSVSEAVANHPLNITVSDLREMSSSRTYDQFITEIRNKACGERKKVEITHHQVEGSLETLNRAAREQLAAQNIFSISHDLNIFSSSNHFEKDTNHVSLVVGQRWNASTKRCEFLFRNSWGTDCSGLENKTITCENDGYIWIPSYQLLKNSDKIDYVL